MLPHTEMLNMFDSHTGLFPEWGDNKYIQIYDIKSGQMSQLSNAKRVQTRPWLKTKQKTQNFQAKFAKTSSWPTFPTSPAVLNCDQSESESKGRKKDKANT